MNSLSGSGGHWEDVCVCGHIRLCHGDRSLWCINPKCACREFEDTGEGPSKQELLDEMRDKTNRVLKAMASWFDTMNVADMQKTMEYNEAGEAFEDLWEQMHKCIETAGKIL